MYTSDSLSEQRTHIYCFYLITLWLLYLMWYGVGHNNLNNEHIYPAIKESPELSPHEQCVDDSKIYQTDLK